MDKINEILKNVDPIISKFIKSQERVMKIQRQSFVDLKNKYTKLYKEYECLKKELKQ